MDLIQQPSRHHTQTLHSSPEVITDGPSRICQLMFASLLHLELSLWGVQDQRASLAPVRTLHPHTSHSTYSSTLPFSQIHQHSCPPIQYTVFTLFLCVPVISFSLIFSWQSSCFRMMRLTTMIHSSFLTKHVRFSM